MISSYQDYVIMLLSFVISWVIIGLTFVWIYIQNSGSEKQAEVILMDTLVLHFTN
jgi:hypothetical protein